MIKKEMHILSDKEKYEKEYRDGPLQRDLKVVNDGLQKCKIILRRQGNVREMYSYEGQRDDGRPQTTPRKEEEY